MLLIRVEMFHRSISRENRYRIMFSRGICNNSMGYENLIVIVLAAGMLLFGSKKLPDLFRSLGRAKSESEKAKLEGQQEREGFKALSGWR